MRIPVVIAIALALGTLACGVSYIGPTTSTSIVVARRSCLLLDVSEYADYGFLFSEQGYLGEYDGIGWITLAITPRYVREKAEIEYSYSDVDDGELLSGFRIQYNWRCEYIQDIARLIYDQAIAMGADAIINIDITTVPQYMEEIDYWGSRIEVTGFAIHRL